MSLFSIHTLSKKNISMHYEARKPRELMFGRYTAYTAKLNEHLAVLPGSNPENCFVETEINDILLYSIPNCLLKRIHYII